MSEVLLFAILAVLVCFVFWLLIGPPPHLTGRRRDGQSNLYHRTIPYCEAVSPPNLPDGWQAVIPHGGEVFFPKSPTRTYQIEIRGVCRLRAAREIFPADALYYAKHGRFLDRHFQLSINGKSFFRTSELRVVDEDRGNHAYQFIYQGDSVALAFGMAYESCVHPDNGYLEARVTPLPDAKAERAREERRKEAEAQAATFSQAVKAVVNYAQLNPNWGNAEYRQRFAEVHHAELIQSQAEIRNNARGFLEKDQLIRYLRRHHPEAVEILFGRLDAGQGPRAGAVCPARRRRADPHHPAHSRPD